MSCCSPCSPCRSLSRCCSPQCVDGSDRCCCYMVGSGSCCCSPCCSCSRLACCPSMSCCIPYPCRRPKHIWDIRSVIPTGVREVCCPLRRPRKPSRESRASRRRMRKDNEDCPACVADEQNKRPRRGDQSSRGGDTTVNTLHISGSTQTQQTVSTPNKFPPATQSQKSIPISSIENPPPGNPTPAVEAPSTTVPLPKTPPTAPATTERQDTGKLSTITSFATPMSAVSSANSTTQHQISLQNSISLHNSEPSAPPNSEINEMAPTTELKSKRVLPTECPKACVATERPNLEAVSDTSRRRPVTTCMEISTQTDLLKLPLAKEVSSPHIQPVSTSSISTSPPTPGIMISPTPSIASPPMLHSIIPPRNLRHPVGLVQPGPPVNPFGLPFVCMPFPMTLGMTKDSTGCPLCGGKNTCTENCQKLLALKGDHDSQRYLRTPPTKDLHPEKPFCDKRASMGDQSSIFTEMTSYSNPSSSDVRHKRNTNSVFFIRRENPSAGGRDVPSTPDRNIDSATRGSPSTATYRDSRRSRYQNQDRGDSDPVSWHRSPSLRSISSQTSADVRKFSPAQLGTGYHPSRFPGPRKYNNRSLPTKPTKAAASQTLSSHFDFGSQTMEDEANKKFSPQNVFFVATPNVTDAWCRAVCGDTVAELPKILEKFGSAKKVSETSINSIEMRKSRDGLSEKRFRKTEVMNESRGRKTEVMNESKGRKTEVMNESPTHPSEEEICDESEAESREKGMVLNHREKYQKKSPIKALPPATPTPAGMLKRSDMLKMSHSGMTKREMIACLLGRTDDKSKGAITIQGSSATKISESGSVYDTKNFTRPSRASSLHRPSIAKQSVGDMSKKDKTNSISGMSDVVMAGPGIGVEKGVCANLRSKMEIQARNANMVNKDRGSQCVSNTVASGAARTTIKKYARRLTSPSPVSQYANRRSSYCRNYSYVSNVPPPPSTNTKVNKLSESKPTLNPSNFGRELVLQSTINEQLKQSENYKNQLPDVMNWREAMGAISVTRISMKPRRKECDVIEDREIKGSYEPAMAEETNPPILYQKDDQDEAYDVCEVEVPANTMREVNNDPLRDDEEMYETCDQESPPPFVTSRREITPNKEMVKGQVPQSNSRERTFVTQRRGGYKWEIHQEGSAVHNNEKRSHNRVQTRPQLVDEETEISERISRLNKPRDLSLPRRVIPSRTEAQSTPGPPPQIGESGHQPRYVSQARPPVHPHRRVSPAVATETRIVSQSCNKRRKMPQGVKPEPVTEASDYQIPSLSSPNRSMESRVEIEDVGADESEDGNPSPNWTLQPFKSTQILRREKSNLSKSSKNSKHSVKSGPHRKKSSQSQARCSTMRSSSNPQQVVINSMDPSPCLLRPTSASLPSNMEGFLRDEEDENGDRRRTRHEYYTSPPNYGLKLSRSSVGTQALSSRPHHSHERRYCAMNHQYALMTIPQPHEPLYQLGESTHISKPRETSSKIKRTVDLRSAYDTRKENNSHVVWNCERKDSKSSLRSGFSDDVCYQHKSRRTARKSKIKDVDYGPEVVIDSRKYLNNVPMMRTRGDRVYADAGEIVLPKQRKNHSWICSKGRLRKDDSHPPGEKKRKEFYFEFGPQSQPPSKPHRHWGRTQSPDRERSPDRDGRSIEPEYKRKQTSRKIKQEELLYELGDYTGESEVEYNRKWKHSQMSLPKQRRIKSTKCCRIYAYSPSKRRIISTPGTPLTSSSNSPHYRHNYRRRSGGRDLNHHAGQRGRKRSASKWD